MEKHTKLLNMVTIINLVIFVLMLVFCFQNFQVDVDGLCEDCMGESMTRGIIFMGLIINILQVMTAALMCVCLRGFNKSYGNLWLVILSVFIILASIQQAFLFNFFDVHIGLGHGAPTLERELLIVKMLNIQMKVVKVMNPVMIVYNIALLIVTRIWYVKERKKLLEYLNS